MSHTSDNGQTGGDADFENFDEFDQRGFAAGRALREPAPEGGLAKVRASSRRRRAAPIVAMGLVAILVLGGLVALTRNRTTSAPASAPEVPTSAVTGTTVTSADITNTANATGSDTGGSEMTSALGSTAPGSSSNHPTANQDGSGAQPAKANEPLLFYYFWNIGRWNGSNFEFANSDSAWPSELEGQEVVVVNHSGTSRSGTVVNCNGSPALSPPPPERGPGNPDNDFVDQWWHTSNAPFTVSETNDDRALTAMNAALIAKGLDPDLAFSVGGPFAADGSVDRLMWYVDADNRLVAWVATFDGDTSTFTTVAGDPQAGWRSPHFPGQSLVDLDGDGNLESIWVTGDEIHLEEWATGDVLWTAASADCPS